MQTNSSCELAESEDLVRFREVLDDLKTDTCRTFFPLCARIAGSGQPITLSLIKDAEREATKTFEKLALHAWDKVRSAL